MTKWRWSGVLVLSLVFMSVAHAFAFALLIEPALAIGARLVVQSVGRQALLEVGIAANDAAWLATAANWVSKAAAILRVVNASGLAYEVPLQPSVAVPGGVKENYTGQTLDFTSPAVGFIYKASGSGGFCGYLGVNMPDATFRTMAEWALACEQYRISKGGSGAVTYSNASSGAYDSVSYTDAGGISRTALVKRMSLQAGPDPYGSIDESTSGTSYWLRPTINEIADGVKRFKRSASGLILDATDPDWTATEKANAVVQQTIQFKNSAEAVNVSANGTETMIQASAQEGLNVRYRDLRLDANAVPTKVVETTYTNADANEVLASNTAANTSTGSASIQFPSDYARQGEASSAANTMNTRLDRIHDDLTKTAQAPEAPAVPDASEFKTGFFDGTFDALKAWRLPGHSSQCPTADLSFTFWGHYFDLNFDAHCQILESPTVQSVAEVSLQVVWLLAALFIVLGA